MPDPLRALVEWLGAGTAEAAPLTPDDEAALETVAGRFPRFAAAVKATRPTLRAATVMERVNDRVQDVYEAVAAQPLGRVADALGMTDFAGMVRSAAEPVGVMGSELTPGPKPKGIRAFHGSPHDFEKFSLEKIGTGEGAQAYGHGLYFAEQEGTAKAYRDALAREYPKEWRDRVGGIIDVHSLARDEARIAANDPEALAASFVQQHNDVDSALTLAARLPTDALGGAERRAATIEGLMSLQRRGVTKKTPGRMYEVNIKADPDQFLDWDAPLKDQPANVKAVANELFRGRLDTRDIGGGMVDVFEKGPGGRPGGSLGVYPQDKVAAVLANPAEYYPYHGERLYDEIARDLGTTHQVSYGTVRHESQPAASARLRRAGIPGIKYLDQGSRGWTIVNHEGRLLRGFGSQTEAQAALQRLPAGPGERRVTKMPYADEWAIEGQPQGTRNFVVFDDATIEILKKYGLLLPVVGAAMQAQSETRK